MSHTDLREQIVDVIERRRFDDNYPSSLLDKDIQWLADHLLPFIEANQQRDIVEARIDELSHVSPDTIISGNIQPLTVAFRIAELKSSPTPPLTTHKKEEK